MEHIALVGYGITDQEEQLDEALHRQLKVASVLTGPDPLEVVR